MERMSTQEMLAEVEHLLAGGVHPYWISRAVDRSIPAIYKAAWRRGNTRITKAFNNEIHEERSRAGEHRQKV
jgi:hypothetical protein